MTTRRKIGILITIALVGVIVFAWRSQPDDLDFVIDPDAVRPWAEKEWTEWTADRRARSMTEEQFFGGIAIEPHSSGTGASYEVPWHETPMDDFWGIDAAATPLKLKAMSVYGLSSPPVERGNEFIPTDYYDPKTGAPVVPLVSRSLKNEYLYQALVDLQFEGEVKDIVVTNVHVFDSITHERLGFGRFEVHQDAVLLANWVTALRPSGGLLAVDYHYGKVSVGDLAVTQGARLPYGDCVLRLMAANELKPWNAPGGRDIRGHGWFDIQEQRAWETKIPSSPGTNLLIGAYPYGPKSGLKFRAMSSSGVELKATAVALPALGYLIRCEAPLAEIARLEVTAPERFVRQMVAIPPIRGLPVANDSVDNMLDLKLPEVRASDWFRGLPVGDGAQVKIWYGEHTNSSRRELPSPQVKSPTVRDLLRHMRNKAGPNARVRYSPENFTILIEDPSADEWFAKLRQRLPPALGGPQPGAGGAPIFDDAARSSGGGFAPAFRWPWQKPEPASAVPVGGAPVFDDPAP